MAIPVDVLIVGDGDLSFSAALVESYIKRGKLKEIWATVLDDSAVARRRYPCFDQNVAKIQAYNGSRVLEQVDAKFLAQQFPYYQFNCIRWNFPHPGAVKGLKENMPEMIQLHEQLIDGFFKACAEVQDEFGSVKLNIIRYPPVTVEKLSELAHHHGYSLHKQKTFDPHKFPGYTRVWGDARDENQHLAVGWDSLGQQLTYKKHLTPEVVPREHLTLRTVGKHLTADDVPKILSACVNYHSEAAQSANQLHKFINNSFQAHIQSVQEWLQKPGPSLLLSFMPPDSHPRKLAFDIMRLLEVAFDGVYGPLTGTLVSVKVGDRTPCCVEVSSTTTKLFLIHVLPPQQTEVRDTNTPGDYCRFKSAVLLITDPQVSLMIQERHRMAMGLQLNGRQICLVDLFKGEAVEICPDSQWLPHVGKLILWEAFQQLKAAPAETAPTVCVPHVQSKLRISTRHGIPFLLPLHCPVHISKLSRMTGLVAVSQQGDVRLTEKGRATAAEAALDRFCVAERRMGQEWQASGRKRGPKPVRAPLAASHWEDELAVVPTSSVQQTLDPDPFFASHTHTAPAAAFDPPPHQSAADSFDFYHLPSMQTSDACDSFDPQPYATVQPFFLGQQPSADFDSFDPQPRRTAALLPHGQGNQGKHWQAATTGPIPVKARPLLAAQNAKRKAAPPEEGPFAGGGAPKKKRVVVKRHERT